MTATDTSLASVGTQVRLAQCADDKGTLTILANDHRQNLRRALGISDRPSTDSLLGEFKALVSTHLASGATGLLVDPQIGLDATIDAGVCGTPLIVALEETGYVASGHERVTRLLPGWDPERLVKCGAHAAKLLIYYRPDARNAGEQESLARRVAQECASAGLPLFLEPLLYSFDTSVIPSILRADLLSETARRLSDTGASVLKLEMPVDVTQESDTTQWRSACDRVTAASAVPWVLLSAGVRHEMFLTQSEVACRHGASGVMAGRAVWSEATTLEPSERVEFLESVAVPRLEELRDLVTAYARPYDQCPARPAAS